MRRRGQMRSVTVAAAAFVLALAGPAAAVEVGTSSTGDAAALQQLVSEGYDADEVERLLDAGYSVEEIERILSSDSGGSSGGSGTSGGTSGSGTVDETVDGAGQTAEDTTRDVTDTVRRTVDDGGESPAPPSGGSNDGGSSAPPPSGGNDGGQAGSSGGADRPPARTSAPPVRTADIYARAASGRPIMAAPFRADASRWSSMRSSSSWASFDAQAPLIADPDDLGMPASAVEEPLVASAEPQDDRIIEAASAPLTEQARRLGAEVSAAAVLLVIATAIFVTTLGPGHARRRT